MNNSNLRLASDDSELPLEVARQLNLLCDEYERQINTGGSIEFTEFLIRIEPEGRRSLLVELVALALTRLRANGVADPNKVVIDRNAQHRDEIEAVLAELSGYEETAIFDPPVAGNAVTSPYTPRRKKSRGLQLRCPHCSNHVEVVGDTQLDSVDCDVCGTNFSLIDRSKETRLAESLQQIGRFELVARIGVGGFGTVWKARDLDLDRVVAIKIPRHGQLSPDEMEAFFREARSVAQLRHPNIVLVHEVGREDDTVFIVSDLVRGVSLSDHLSGKRPTPRESAALCMIIASALEHAHSKGVIHRDLKPSNVMIDDDGQPHIMDFGLAKREAEEITMTIDGQIIGTPAYMSPEQASGKSAWADRRADIYSLGVIMFELLTGEIPFRGNAQMQVFQRLNDDAPNVCSLNRHIPLDLATICAKCLERAQGSRYQTAQELGQELSRYLDNLPIKARPLSPPRRLIRWAQRRPLQAVIATLVSFLAIAGPMVAMLIERQRASLDALVTEKDNLIQTREAERQAAVSQASTLRAELDVWEGRANPSAFWPPAANFSPQRRQLASLMTARRGVLDQQPSDFTETEIGRARRHLALATLHEAASRDEDAIAALQTAVKALEVELAATPNSVPLALALADSCQRLAELTATKERADSLAWLARARETLRQTTEHAPLDPRVVALHQDAELRSAVAAGFESATEELAEAAQAGSRLKGLWPKSPDEIYALACELSGRPAYLDEAVTEITAPAE